SDVCSSDLDVVRCRREQCEPAVEMPTGNRQRRVRLHRSAVIASGHERHRRPECTHTLKMRLPIGDTRCEDWPEYHVRSNTVVERVDEDADHVLVGAGPRALLRCESRTPCPAITMINRGGHGVLQQALEASIRSCII